MRELGALIDESTANEAQALAASIRECGALRHLLQLVDHPSSESDALRVIGNLASNAVDPQAFETKRLSSNAPTSMRFIFLFESFSTLE